MPEKNITFKLDEDLIIDMKKRALDERVTQKELLTKWIKEKLSENWWINSKYKKASGINERKKT